MIIGYCLDGQDNNTFMVEEGSIVERCSKCKNLKDFNYHNPFYKINKKSYDFSHPYDIGNIVSLKFKEFCIREKYEHIAFKEFERSPGFFQFYSNKILAFDADRSGTKFSNFCNECGNYGEVIGTIPPFLKHITRELEDGFYRTDLIFGSKDSKNSIIIVAPETHKKLKREKMKGMHFTPISI